MWCIIESIHQYIGYEKMDQKDLDALESLEPKVLDKKNAE
jgi:hypothetical protein